MARTQRIALKMDGRANNGGRRPGSGRPKGSRDKTAEAKHIIERNLRAMIGIVPEAVARMTPLEVMLYAMALEAAAGRWLSAARIAADVSPFIHPRLASVQPHVRNDLAKKTDAEIQAEIDELAKRATAMKSAPAYDKPGADTGRRDAGDGGASVGDGGGGRR